jgi:putative PEP-CTERM system histidine kinase
MSLTVLIAVASAICGSALALTVLLREGRSVAAGSFAAGMAMLAAESAFAGLSAQALSPEKMVFWERFALITLSCLPGMWLLFSLSYSRGNYREILAGRWPLVAAAFIIPIVLAVGFQGTIILGAGPAAAGDEWSVLLGVPGIALHLLFLLGGVITLMNLERTFRASVGTMRWQIKYTLMGLAALFAVRVFTSSQVILFHAVSPSLSEINAGALLLGCAMIAFSLFRARLFAVDLYPSQAVLSSSLTVLLAGIYLLAVGILAKFVSAFGGDAAFPLKAFLVLASLVALAMLLLSERVRQNTNRFVSRHFRRPHHDYRQVWMTFTGRTTSLMEAKDLCHEATKCVSETFQILSATIWLVDDKMEGLSFGASTSLAEATAKNLMEFGADVTALIRAVQQQGYPVDIDRSKEQWVEELKRRSPEYFQDGGHRLCVPLVAGGELLGIMTLGDRVSGVPFSVEDLDLLKCVGDQVAGYLLNIQLSKRLLQAKEMEAFQTMSAFFVHDLKNTASTLSLLLENLPAQFENPAFRQDAFRAVSKSVTRINDLIGRLSLLRQKLEVRPSETDLNSVVSAAIGDLGETCRATVVRNLRPLPKILLDPEHMQKVITNLLLNANDAIGNQGEIRVETDQQNGWVVLSVADNGCGMSAEFLSHSLFRPFQTTKKKGIGIGMFHSKMIVEAHRGKIEVQSEPGKGSTFKVLLPLKGEAR